MFDLSENRTKFPYTLTQDGKSTLRMKNQSWDAWSMGYGRYRENMEEMLVWIGMSKAWKMKTDCLTVPKLVPISVYSH